MDATLSQNQACKDEEEEENVMFIICTVLQRHMMLWKIKKDTSSFMICSLMQEKCKH